MLFIVTLAPLTLRWGVAGAIVATGLSQAAKLVSNLILMRQVKPGVTWMKILLVGHAVDRIAARNPG